jgi:REP element-mobilizing transposase RayT
VGCWRGFRQSCRNGPGLPALKAPAQISPGQSPGFTAWFFLPTPKGREEMHALISCQKPDSPRVQHQHREPVLAEAVRAPVCAYAAGVLRDLDSPAIAISAWRDHLHVLFSLTKNQPLSQVVMEVKRATSKWLKTQAAEFANFHWQAGYGAFSIGQSGVKGATAYIANQPEHHRSANPSSVAECPLCRQAPKVGAVCGKSARTVLCGGRPVMAGPTANISGKSPRNLGKG